MSLVSFQPGHNSNSDASSMTDTPISSSLPNPVLHDLFFDPPLNIFLSPVKGPHDPNPTRHWLLILSPPNGLHATFYHILKDPVWATFKPNMYRYRYRRGPVLHNVPLHSTIPISNNRASLNKIGVVMRSAHDGILALAEETMSSFASERQPWTVLFLDRMQEEGFLAEGTNSLYHRFCEPVKMDDLAGLMGGMEIDKGVEEKELMEMMGGMDLGGYATGEEERKFMEEKEGMIEDDDLFGSD
ncbi:hypothetical protein BDW69DRAFT_188475 [Aspergillus filifer]